MKWLLVTALLLMPVIAHAQVQAQTFTVLDYSTGVNIPQGPVTPADFPTPQSPPQNDGTWLVVTIPVPVDSTSITVGFNTLSWPQGGNVMMVFYAYDAEGNFLQSTGKITQSVANRHATELTVGGWGPTAVPRVPQPSTIVFYARAAQAVTSPSWILSR